MRWRVVVLVAGVIVVAGASVSLVDSGYEITQIRNSMIAERGVSGDFDWTPDRTPPGFLQETAAAPRDFRQVADALVSTLPPSSSELEVAIALARHLDEGPGPGGGGIKSDTSDAYRQIRTSRMGYCSDYTQVMNGLAYASGVPIREWGMSFGEYTGDGHAFSEIFDRTLGKWVFVDSFYSFYAVDRTTGLPLSVLELRERLANGEGERQIDVRVISPEQFGFKNAAMALHYYRRGMEHFFLYFGNNVFSYDENRMVAALGPVSRALEELSGIAQGILPGIRLFRTKTNEPDISTLFFRGYLFLVLVAVLLVMMVLVVRELRRAPGRSSPHSKQNLNQQA